MDSCIRYIDRYSKYLIKQLITFKWKYFYAKTLKAVYTYPIFLHDPVNKL